MDQTTDIIFEWDISRDYLSCSSNYHKKFGYHALKENASVAIAWGSHLHPDDIERFCLLVRNVREGTPYSETEFRIADAAEIISGAGSAPPFRWTRTAAPQRRSG